MKSKDSNSRKLFAEAKKYIPGGVNSPVRAFKEVDGEPVFIRKASGAILYDVDGNKYVDLVCSYGALILGHARPEVIGAARRTLRYGTNYSAPTQIEIAMAKEIAGSVKSIEKVRMVNSGTEATMSAIRLARGYTGKDKIIKFDGCYHGHVDSLLVKPGSGALTLSLPDSSGIPAGVVENTISVPYNDLDAFEKTVKKEKENLACVIVEPVAGNMGVVPPKDGFLAGLREITEDHDVLLIFDEVITGYRLCYGGAQDHYKVYPDITCLGKIIGGGFPVGAYGGRADIMDQVAPDGPVYQAGTLSGNPVALSAGLSTLGILKRKGVYGKLEKNAGKLKKGITELAEENRVDVQVAGEGSMFCIFFSPDAVHDVVSAKRADKKKYSIFFNSMLDDGLYLPPGQFESLFLSTAHVRGDLDKILEACGEGFKEVSRLTK
ncbi:MAG: glutamate-1-semialdehyde 2,1-aminomutase [Candidatus Altiarchaeia archaeon]